MPNKYNARRTTVDNITFDSKREAARYNELKWMQAAGHISDLVLQPMIPLRCGGKPIMTPKGRDMVYRADFSYKEAGQIVFEDVKGRDTKLSALKRAIVKAEYGIDVVIIK